MYGSMSQGNLSGLHNPRWQHLVRTVRWLYQSPGTELCKESQWNTLWSPWMHFCTLITGKLMVNLRASVFHRSSVTWSSHNVWKKSQLLQPIYLIHFLRGKSHTLVSLWKLIKDSGSRLWPFWTLFLHKNIHKQLLECMIMFAQSWQKWEAIRKEYSDSISFVGFQKWKTWPGPCLPKLWD